MPKPVTITVRHQLGTADAKSRIENGFVHFSQKLGLGIAVNHNWDNDTLNFDARIMAQSISGSVIVRDADVIISILLPALLAGMAGTIKDKLKKESTFLLEKK